MEQNLDDKDFSDSNNKRLWAHIVLYVVLIPFLVVPFFFFVLELFLFFIYPGGVALPLYVALWVMVICFLTSVIYLAFQHEHMYFKIDEEKIVVSLGVFAWKRKKIYFTSIKNISLESDSKMSDLKDVVLMLDDGETFKLEGFSEEDAQRFDDRLQRAIHAGDIEEE